MNRSPLVVVLSTLWKMLSQRRKVNFIGLIGVLFVAGLLDMTGMLLIFGFIAGLKTGADGERAGKLGELLRLVAAEPLSQQAYIIYVGSLVVGVLLIKNALSTLAQFYLNKFLMKLNQQVSEGLFNGYLLSPYESLNERGGSVTAKNITKIFDVFSLCFSSVAQLLVDGTMTLMVIALLCLVDPIFTLVGALMFGGVGAILYRGMQKGLVLMGREDQEARKQAGGYLADGIHGVLETRLRDARKSIVVSYSRALARTALLRRRKMALERLPRSANEIALAVMIVGSVFYLTYFGSGIDAALPTLGLFGFAGLRLTSAMTRLNAHFQRLKNRAEEFEGYYQSVLEVAPKIFGEEPKEGALDYLKDEEPLPKGNDGKMHRALTLDNVSFRYPSGKTDVVKGVSIEVPLGSFVALCGPSGGGKSTLLLLLMGLIRPTSGAIKCDDWEIPRHIRAWHSNIGYVGQQMYVSNRTIRENVAFAVPPDEIDDKKVWASLRMASAEEFVKRLPGRLKHVLREGGTNLSGGQRQRIAIARALYRDPDIIVFDEATAALDNVTEREIGEAIRILSDHKTVICVAHRLSTIRHADRIYVLSDGAVEAGGTYEELLQTSSTFQALAHASGDGSLPPKELAQHH